MASKITTHVLDLVLGKPAAGIGVELEQQLHDMSWRALARGKTNSDGRVTDLLPDQQELLRGSYRLIFQTAPYFHSGGVYSIYPSITVAFEVQDVTSHYHIPLLLSPHGYTTYRGS